MEMTMVNEFFSLIITRNHVWEFLALLTSLLFINSLKKGKLASLPFFLLFILLVELYSSYLTRILLEKNKWLYNLSIPVEYTWYLLLYWLHGGRSLKKAALYAQVIFSAVAVYFFLAAPFDQLHIYTLVTGEALVILCSCIYFYELFQSSDEQPLFRNYFFWLVCGLFLFNLGDITYFGLLPVIRTNKWDNLDLMFEFINNSMIPILYLSYIFAVLVFRKYGITENAQ